VGAHRVKRRGALVASRVGLGVLVISLGTAATLAAQASPAAQRELHAATTRLPEHFTELYFTTDPPVATADRTARPSVGFAVANHEGRAVTYPYLVARSDPSGHPVVLASGEVTVGPGAVGRRRVTVPPVAADDVISVRLVGRAEHIHARVAP
jgi:hypothetical protein